LLFVVYLTTIFSNLEYRPIASNESVISELWIGKDSEESYSGLILRHYPSIRLEGLRKITRNLSQDSRSPGQDLKPRPPVYENGSMKCKSDVKLSRIRHAGVKRRRGIALIFDLGTRWSEWSVPRPGRALPPGKALRYPLDRWLRFLMVLVFVLLYLFHFLWGGIWEAI
jgi:hypothetical protein